jgi:hypothetical protein
MKRLLMWWIDDETDRLNPSAQKAISRPPQIELRNRTADLQLKKVKAEKDILSVISEIADIRAGKGALPDLIIIDQRLDLESKKDVVQRGSSVAVALRTQAPSVPLVGVTGADIDEIFSLLQKEQFIDVFARSEIHRFDRIPDLYGIADGFAVLWKNFKKLSSTAIDKNLVRRLLRMPAEDADLLYDCIPGRFKRPWDEEMAHSFSRWVLHTLMARPGFLYDDLEIATLLGLNVTGFERIAAQFSGCAYRGVFNCVSRRRWWVSLVRAEARRLVSESFSKPLWEAGRELLGRQNRSQFSRCYGPNSSPCIPDVVAYLDERCDPRKRVQAKASDTRLIEPDAPPVGFEQRRIFSRR